MIDFDNTKHVVSCAWNNPSHITHTKKKLKTAMVWVYQILANLKIYNVEKFTFLTCPVSDTNTE